MPLLNRHKDPGNLTTSINMVKYVRWAYDTRCAYEQALEVGARALPITKDPNNKRMLIMGLAEIHCAMGNPEQAIAVLELGKREFPKNTNFLYYRDYLKGKLQQH